MTTIKQLRFILSFYEDDALVSFITPDGNAYDMSVHWFVDGKIVLALDRVKEPEPEATIAALNKELVEAKHA